MSRPRLSTVSHRLAGVLLALAATGACSGPPPEPDSVSPTARLETTAALLEDLDTPRHAADGGGKAWLQLDDASTPSFQAGQSGRFHLVYEAGPQGIQEGGALYLLVSPFWGWSSPQTVDRTAPGFTLATSTAQGITLEPLQLDTHLLATTIGGRALASGERIEIVYGAGEAGATVDRHAESESRLWLAVDGDGDGVRQLIDSHPAVTITAGKAAQMVLHLPSITRPGERVELQLAVLDAVGNAWPEISARVRLSPSLEGTGLPQELSLEAADRGLARISFAAPDAGVLRIDASIPADGQISARSNPMLVQPQGQRILWGDLHGHSALSDGSGTPEDYLRYAREVAALDVAALTDHDHWGVEFLDATPSLWSEIVAQTAAFHEPGRFVTLLGYEWTSWVHGHRHVLFFTDEGEILSSLDERYDTPAELWQALRGRPAMTFAHHSAGGPIATNWDFAPDPELEPCTEVASVHGSSEALDAPVPIYSAVPGNSVRDALDRGYRFGFVGSGDSHDGHPGLAHLGAPAGGVAAILSDELSRESVREALQQRRVYATNGPRLILRFAVNGHGMGSVVPAPTDGRGTAYARIVAVAPLETVELIRSGVVVAAHDAEGALDAELSLELEGLEAGEYLYLRAVQEDDGAAWSSPVYFE